MMRASIISTVFIIGMVCAMPLAAAQSANPPAGGAEVRSLEEVKAEVMRRASIQRATTWAAPRGWMKTKSPT